MSSLLLAAEPSPLGAVSAKRIERLPSSLPGDSLLYPLAIAFALHLVLIGLGFLNRHDTLLSLIAKGEVEAVAPTISQPQEEEVTLDDTPPPPPEANPDFIKPEDVRPKVVETPKPKPKVETPAPAPAASYAATNFVIGDKNFPQPPYPYEAKVRRYQGTVVVAIDVAAGQIVNADIASSSGYGILDASTLQWIRQRWHFPTDVTRNLTLPVKFQLLGT